MSDVLTIAPVSEPVDLVASRRAERPVAVIVANPETARMLLRNAEPFVPAEEPPSSLLGVSLKIASLVPHGYCLRFDGLGNLIDVVNLCKGEE